MTGSLWRYNGGDFRRVGGGTWHEFQNGQLAFMFMQTAQSSDEVFLFDASRGFTVRLTHNQAIVTAGSTTLLTLNGEWIEQEWTYSTGRFRHLGGGSWREFQNGQPAFSFVEVARSSDVVILFDASRGINVRLTPTQAVVTSGPNTLMTIPGNWTG